MVANAEKGESSLVIGGVTYVLAQDYKALMTLQNMLARDGKKPKVSEMLQRMEDEDLEVYCGFFWVMLQRHHPEITFDGAADLITLAGGREALDKAMLNAHVASAPDPVDVRALGGVPGNPLRPVRAKKSGIGARLT